MNRKTFLQTISLGLASMLMVKRAPQDTAKLKRTTLDAFKAANLKRKQDRMHRELVAQQQAYHHAMMRQAQCLREVREV